MWTRALLKENAKIAFKRNYWTCVIVSVILLLVGGGMDGTDGPTLRLNLNTAESGFPAYGGANNNGITVDFTGQHLIMMSAMAVVALFVVVFALAFTIFVVNIITVGGKRYFMENREHKTAVGQIFYGFQGGNYFKCMKTMFFKELYLLGWTCLFIIPGIIKSYSYMLVPYILAENPNLSKDRAIELSREMMDGYKMEAFVLGWSFLGWDIVSVATVGIAGIFYVNPYKYATYAEFYAAVKADAFNRGITNSLELPGVSLQGPAPEFHEESAQQENQAAYEEDIFAEDQDG